jgi:hypothetical protein
MTLLFAIGKASRISWLGSILCRRQGSFKAWEAQVYSEVVLELGACITHNQWENSAYNLTMEPEDSESLHRSDHEAQTFSRQAIITLQACHSRSWIWQGIHNAAPEKHVAVLTVHGQ